MLRWCVVALLVAIVTCQRYEDGLCANMGSKDRIEYPCDGENEENYNKECYMSFSSGATWELARVECAALGGDLAVTVKKSAFKGVESLLGANLDDLHWVGGADCNGQGKFTFTDTSKLKKQSQFLDMVTGRGDCLAFRTSSGRLENHDCATSLPYVCQVSIKTEKLINNDRVSKEKAKALEKAKNAPANQIYEANKETALMNSTDIFEMDIKLTREQTEFRENGGSVRDMFKKMPKRRKDKVEKNKGKNRSKRNALSVQEWLWPKINGYAIVPYVVDYASYDTQGGSGYYDNNFSGVIQEAMSDIEAHTIIRFVPRTTEYDYLNFIYGSGCWSYIGGAYAKQDISIGNNCNRVGIVEHELSHALGLYHEQSRDDRDNFVRINFENIISGKSNNFEIASLVTNQGMNYDYGSVMHYGSYYFSSNGDKTIETLPPYADVVIGQREGLSPNDFAELNKLYGNTDDIDGDWNYWQSWSSCSATCGTSERTRVRLCDLPAPEGPNALPCAGPDTDTEPCLKPICDNVRYSLGCWYDISNPPILKLVEDTSLYTTETEPVQACENTASALGFQVFALKNGVCTVLDPAYADFYDYQEQGPSDSCNADDTGAPDAISVFYIGSDPVNGQWSTWQSAGDCSTTCGGGSQTLTRTCDNPKPQNGGADCVGEAIGSQECGMDQCPIHGGVSEWAEWGTCSASCGGGSQTRERLCNNPAPLYGGDDCEEYLTEPQNCGDELCPVDGKYGEWTAWSSCDVTCGDGEMTRSRDCNSPAPANGGAACFGDSIETLPCKDQECPIDGGYSGWGTYSSCSTSCGAGTSIRSRTCTNPKPQFGGADCVGSPTQSTSCNDGDCPVDGGYSEWGTYSSCSTSCGTGTSIRSRTCTNPKPQFGGADCVGPPTESASCNDGDCPVDGGYTEWSPYNSCSASCGTGTSTRTRTCTNPKPQFDGADCVGEATESISCNNGECPVDGGYTEWSPYSSCSASCGTGTRTRTRTCTNPKPQFDGADCVGEATESISCNSEECPVDGSYSEWSPYSSCSTLCGTGTSTRTRTCTNPKPQFGGADCVGEATESISCNNGDCPVDGGYTDWSTYSSCSTSCGTGTSTRTRTCTNPKPENGGADCVGQPTESISCKIADCPVDGGYSEWSAYSSCSTPCGTGTSTRTRTCTNPKPENGGADCVGELEESISCNIADCPVDGGYTDWSVYSSCSTSCGSGTSTRSRTCTNPQPQFGGAECVGEREESIKCNIGDCPVDGGYSNWSDFSVCSETCGTGTYTRTRSCTNPAPENGGQDCSWLGDDTETQECFVTECPIDGGWTKFTEWSDCSVTCGSGIETRTRNCTNPEPQFGGNSCSGHSIESTECTMGMCPINSEDCEPAPRDQVGVQAEAVISYPFNEICQGQITGYPESLVIPVSAALETGRDGNSLKLENQGFVMSGLPDSMTACLTDPATCTNGISVSLWMKQTAEERSSTIDSRPQYIFSTGAESEEAETSNNRLGVSMHIRKDGMLKVLLRSSKSVYTVDLPAYLFEVTDTWHHVAFTYSEQTGLLFYYKGKASNLDYDGRVNEEPGDETVSTIYFGRSQQCFDHFFVGSIDSFLIWDRVLTNEEMYEVFSAEPFSCADCDRKATCSGTECTCPNSFEGDGFYCTKVLNGAVGVLPDPLYAWPMNKILKDEVDGSAALIVGEDMMVENVGIDGSAVSFDGRRDWLDAGDLGEACLAKPDDCNAGLTISFWMKYHGRGVRDNYVLSTGAQANSTGIAMYVNGDTLYSFIQTTDTKFNVNTAVTQGTWAHFVLRWTQTDGLSIYVNGNRAASDAFGVDEPVAQNLQFTGFAVGKPNNKNVYNGRFAMDRLTLWIKALSENDIAFLYNNGYISMAAESIQ